MTPIEQAAYKAMQDAAAKGQSQEDVILVGAACMWRVGETETIVENLPAAREIYNKLLCSDGAELTLAAQTLPERYGNRKVPKMLAEISALRNAIRAEGTPNIQGAWDRVEEFIDFLPQEVARRE